MYHEQFPSYIAPGSFTGQLPMYDRCGPVGQLRDMSSEAGLTIGQQALSQYPPIHGWMVGSEGGYAYPFYGVPGQPPPGAIEAMLADQYYAAQNYAAQGYSTQQTNTKAEFMAALLLMMF